MKYYALKSSNLYYNGGYKLVEGKVKFQTTTKIDNCLHYQHKEDAENINRVLGNEFNIIEMED